VSTEPTPVQIGGRPKPERLNVTGIGNALLDVIMQDHDNVHAELGLAKGGMTLVDLAEAHEIYGAMNSTLEMSGGSAANTIAGIASLGGQTGFIGKVGADNFGEVFAHDLSSLGATVDLTVAETNELGTGRCHVFVTDDAERTMATYLGAANQMEPEDITSDLIRYSDIVYIEGYLFDLPPAKDALRQAIATTHDHDGLVALSLSDLFCVERHKADFLELITNDVDILLANEGEILTMFGAKTVEQAFQAIDELGVLGVVTIGSKGAMVSGPRGPLLIPAPKVDRVVDQNGAGDLFAAGFLYGLATGAEPAEAAQLAALCAGEVITHLGARPEADLFELASAAGLL
jgi:sugar/nucleoside kinase (ribokinase family)